MSLGLTACIQVPELDRSISDDARNAPFPELAPIDPSVFETPPPAEAQAEIDAELQERAQTLRDRASALEEAKIDDETRNRLLGTLDP